MASANHSLMQSKIWKWEQLKKCWSKSIRMTKFISLSSLSTSDSTLAFSKELSTMLGKILSLAPSLITRSQCLNGEFSKIFANFTKFNSLSTSHSYDFYLISQNTRQGCVAPTSYNIIADSSNLTPDKIQVLTYKNCYLYYNWSGTMYVNLKFKRL